MTPVPYSDLITAGTGVVSDLGLLPVILAGAVIGLAGLFLRRMRTAAR